MIRPSVSEPKPMSAISGTCFAVLFVGGGIALGNLLGSFADPDETFESFFADADNWFLTPLATGAAL